MNWISSKHNMGMAMNREVWQKIKKCTEVSSEHDSQVIRYDALQITKITQVNSYSASHDNWCTVGGDGGCRVGKVRAGTTSPMPDHKGFKLQ